MRRRLFHFAAGMSLLLCVAVVAIAVRGAAPATKASAPSTTTTTTTSAVASEVKIETSGGWWLLIRPDGAGVYGYGAADIQVLPAKTFDLDVILRDFERLPTATVSPMDRSSCSIAIFREGESTVWGRRLDDADEAVTRLLDRAFEAAPNEWLSKRKSKCPFLSNER